MAKYVQWTTHKGKSILFVNCAGLKEAEYLKALQEFQQAMLQERSAPLVLIDLTRTQITTATMNRAKELTSAAQAAGVPFGPNAVVGMSKVMKSVATLSARQTHFADTVEEGKEWLVLQDEKRS